MAKQIYKYGTLYYPNETNRKNFFCLKTEVDVYQEYINDVVKKYAKKDSLILDVGANVGIFTISFSKLFPSSTIYSFECVASTKEYLEKNIRENKCENVVIHDFALSDKNEETEITFNKDNIGNASIKLKPGDTDERIKIQTKKLRNPSKNTLSNKKSKKLHKIKESN